MSSRRLTKTHQPAQHTTCFSASRTASLRNPDIHPVHHLQRTIGNQAVNQLLQARTLQAKFAVSQPGDVYEQEADRVADQVMRMPDPAIQRTCAPCAAGGSLCPQCAEENNLKIQRAADSSGTEAEQGVPDDFVHNLGPGQSLDDATRAFFEPRFGADFSQVRVHTGPQATASARAVNALAYTVGRDVVFGADQYAPQSGQGRHLLAHELAHVMQQGGAHANSVDQKGEDHGPPSASTSTAPRASRIRPSDAPGRAVEHKADLVAGPAVLGPAVMARTMSECGARLQRVCGPRAIGNPAGCDPFGTVATEQIFSALAERFLFTVNCNDFNSPAELARLRALASGIAAADPVDIHGFASEEGDATYNAHLSCSRALRARDELVDARTRAGLPPLNIRGIFNHGATAFGTRDVNRSVVIPLSRPPTLDILEAGFVGPPSANQRRAAASCPIDCDGRTLGTMHAMGIFFHRSRGPILPNGDPTADGIGTSLHFTETAIDIPDTDRCHCDDYGIIQAVDRSHPPAGRANPGIDNNGQGTPFYNEVFLSGEGIHEIPGGYPDAGERVQSTISIYDRPFIRSARWEAEACVACIKNGAPDRIFGCVTYGFTKALTAAAGDDEQVTAIDPSCLAAPSATFLTALRTDPTVAAYDFEGR